VKLKHIHLANILADHGYLEAAGIDIVPEYIQDAAKSTDMAASLEVLLDDPQSRDKQIGAFSRLREVLQPPGNSSTSSQAILRSLIETLSASRYSDRP